MFIEMQTTITSRINVETLDVEHSVVIEAGEASVLGSTGVRAVALGGAKSAVAALETGVVEETEETST